MGGMTPEEAMDHQPRPETPDRPACAHCGGQIAATGMYCLSCGQSTAPAETGFLSDPTDRSTPVFTTVQSGTASLAGRLAAQGTGLLRRRAGGTGLLGGGTGQLG